MIPPIESRPEMRENGPTAHAACDSCWNTVPPASRGRLSSKPVAFPGPMEREADMKQWLMLVLAVAGLLIAVACNIPAQCDASQLGAPGNLAPAAREIVSLIPSLTWTYPPSSPSPYPYPAGSPDCALSGYQVHLVQAGSEATEYGGSSIYQNFTPAEPLLPLPLPLPQHDSDVRPSPPVADRKRSVLTQSLT